MIFGDGFEVEILLAERFFEDAGWIGFDLPAIDINRSIRPFKGAAGTSNPFPRSDQRVE
jgi:hypothetical protein